jgi:alkylated DNA repair dioxygenase AlkB
MCDRSFGNNDTKLAQSVSSCPNPFQVDPGLLYQRMAASNPTDNKRQPWTVLVTKYRPVHNMGCHQHCEGSNTRPWSIPPCSAAGVQVHRTTYSL